MVRVIGFDSWLCCGKAIWLQLNFELVAAICHWHLAFNLNSSQNYPIHPGTGISSSS